MTLVHFEPDEEIKAKKEEHLKKLLELCEKSLGEIPKLEAPNQEQKQWIDMKIKGGLR